AVNHLAAVGFHVALELFQVVIEVVDGVLLERVGLGAQFLVIGQDVVRRRLYALLLEAPGGRVDGQLQVGVGQGVVDFPIEFDRHGVSGSPGLRPGAWCECSSPRAKGHPESASGNSGRAIRRYWRPCPRWRRPWCAPWPPKARRT